jgi:hypothetical protein
LPDSEISFFCKKTLKASAANRKTETHFCHFRIAEASVDPTMLNSMQIFGLKFKWLFAAKLTRTIVGASDEKNITKRDSH